jgi:hypothetical protein
MVERRLSQVATRLKSLRDELALIDEQLDHLATDADDQAIRALVSETPGAAAEANDARKHADAMASHRAHIVSTIAELEQRQDELLDKLTASR